MAERTTYTDEQKAAALADLLGGLSLVQAAEKHNIPRGTLSVWRSKISEQLQPVADERNQELLKLVYENLAAIMEATRSIAEHFGSSDRLEKDTTAESLNVYRTLFESQLRLLDGLAAEEPQSDRDELEERRAAVA